MRRLGLRSAGPLLALALLLAPAGALGAANHPFLSAINGGYEDACGVARHGGLYVSSYYQDKVNLPSGQISPESTGSGPCKIELDAAGDLYVNNWHQDAVKYSASELLPGQGTVIDSANPTGLTVEQSTGDLYVAHRTYIAKYDAAGTLLEAIGSVPGELEEAYGVAVSEFPATAGDIYVPDAATNTVKVFDSGGALIEEMNGAATPQGRFTYFRDGEIALDNSPTSPSYGHIYVLDAIGHGLSERPAAVIDEFNAAGEYRGQIANFTDAEPSGIAIEGAVGPTIGNVYVTSGNSEASQVFEYGPTAPARTLKVEKEGAGGGTVTSSPVGVVCGPECSPEFNESQTVTLFADPDGHSGFAGWSVSGSEPCPGTGTCTVVMAHDVTVKASFTEPTQETLTLTASGEGTVTSNPSGISCPVGCSEHFAQGRVVTLTARPAPHQELVGWSGCTPQTNQAECKVTMSEAKAVGATFTPTPQLSLGVTLGGSGQGTVSSYPPAISCPGACSASFDQGSTVYLMAAPSPGSGFGGFTGGGCRGRETICVLPMSSAQNVVATFTGAAAGPATRAAASSLAITLVRTAGYAALVRVGAQEAGTLVASGSGLSPVKRELSAGTSTLRVHLGRPARRLLARRGRLHLRLLVGFVPAGGDPSTARILGLGFHGVPAKAAKLNGHRRR